MGTNDESHEYEADLQAEIDKVKAEQAALQAEFNTSDSDSSPELVRKTLLAAAPLAIQEIVNIATMGESEGARLSASKYIADVALGKVTIGDPTGDAFNKLLLELKARKDKKQEQKNT